MASCTASNYRCFPFPLYQAVERETGRIVAVKKVIDAFRNSVDARRTTRETLALIELRRRSVPGIVK